MPTRAACVPLLTRLRTELGTEASAIFGLDALQVALDRRRTDVYRLPLTPAHTTTASGTIQYLDYYAQAPGGLPLADWEGALAADGTPDGYLIQSGTWTDVTAAAEADLLTGYFHFATDHRPPLYLTGHYFDFWTVVGDCLTTYAREFMHKVNFSSGLQRVDLSRQHEQILRQAQAAYARRTPRPRRLTRGDSRC